MSSTSTGGGDLNTPRASYFSLSCLTDSWKTLGSVSVLAPSNPTRVEWGYVGTNCSKDGRVASGK